MTREQAKREIDSLDFYLQNHTDDYGEESHTAMMMAIKALEQEPCEDAISRQAVIDVIERWLECSDYNGAERNIMRATQSILYDLPPVNPQPKTGHWEWVQYDYNPKIGNWHCSECRSVVVECVSKEEKGGIPLYKYCPQCGAKMSEIPTGSDPQESEKVN